MSSLATASARDAREPLRAARARDDPEARLDEPELGRVGREAEVARERELEPAAEGRAVDGRDHGPREGRDGVDDGVERAQERPRLLERHRAPLLEIGARAEGLAARARER